MEASGRFNSSPWRRIEARNHLPRGYFRLWALISVEMLAALVGREAACEPAPGQLDESLGLQEVAAEHATLEL